jgi:hypothetical protein
MAGLGNRIMVGWLHPGHGQPICACGNQRSLAGMPSRDNKPRREVRSADPSRRDERPGQPINKVQGQRLSPARTHTRINAFITSMGRRNQAKRDAR